MSIVSSSKSSKLQHKMLWASSITRISIMCWGLWTKVLQYCSIDKQCKHLWFISCFLFARHFYWFDAVERVGWYRHADNITWFSIQSIGLFDRDNAQIYRITEKISTVYLFNNVKFNEQASLHASNSMWKQLISISFGIFFRLFHCIEC